MMLSGKQTKINSPHKFTVYRRADSVVLLQSGDESNRDISEEKKNNFVKNRIRLTHTTSLYLTLPNPPYTSMHTYRTCICLKQAYLYMQGIYF